MQTEFEIAGRKIGPDHPPLVIAEIGINHNGSLTIAKAMVDAAKRAGVELIKHQTHIIEDEMSAAAKKVIPGNAGVSIYDIMENCALSEEEEYSLKNYVEAQGMLFISTPFSRAAANRLFEWNIPAYKIGSGECNNFPLVQHISSFGKPVLLSTGMNSMNDIEKSVRILKKASIPFALLHCTNVYPTPYKLVRLNAITEMQQHFPNVPIGLSDHSLSIYPCLGAIALGACIVERHFTDHKNRTGPDIEVSMDEIECKQLIEGSQALWLASGGTKYSLLEEEQVTRDFAYASVVSIAPIRKGEKFSKENIWVKRPGTGEIHARHYEGILGKESSTYIGPDQLLQWNDVKQ